MFPRKLCAVVFFYLQILVISAVTLVEETRRDTEAMLDDKKRSGTSRTPGPRASQSRGRDTEGSCTQQETMKPHRCEHALHWTQRGEHPRVWCNTCMQHEKMKSRTLRLVLAAGTRGVNLLVRLRVMEVKRCRHKILADLVETVFLDCGDACRQESFRHSHHARDDKVCVVF